MTTFDYEIRDRLAKVETLVSERGRVADEKFQEIMGTLRRMDDKIDGIPNGSAHRRDRLVTMGGASIGGGGIVGLIMMVAKAMGWV